MKAVSRAAVLALSLLMVAGFTSGCAKTSEQKQQETKSDADSAIADFKSTVQSALDMGTPSVDWSEERLTQYETILGQIETKANRVESFNGVNDVYITGTYALSSVRDAVRSDRRAIVDIRARKAQAHHANSAEATKQDIEDHDAAMEAILKAGSEVEAQAPAPASTSAQP